MDIKTAIRTFESKHSSEVALGRAESGDVKTSADDLAALLRRISESPAREIEKLINQLQRLRTQLEDASNRIQRDIVEYAELSRQITEVTAIISGSVKNLPRGHR